MALAAAQNPISARTAHAPFGAQLARLLDDLLLDLGREFLLWPALPHGLKRVARAAAQLRAQHGLHRFSRQQPSAGRLLRQLIGQVDSHPRQVHSLMTRPRSSAIKCRRGQKLSFASC